MRDHWERLLVIVAALALSASRPVLSAPQTPLNNDLSRSSNPSATPVNGVVVTKGPAPDAFGTTSNTWFVATPWDAQPIDSTFTYSFVNLSAGGQGIAQSNPSGSPWVHIPIHVPAGAVVTHIESNYCDTGAADISGFLLINQKNGSQTSTEFLSSSGTPGCVVETATLLTPITIDNDGNQYWIELFMGNVTDQSIVFASLRVGYHLQVSPAPGMATFSDVPTSYWAFQYIEALAASGITVGCGPGIYCPEDPVTRAQMAVFFAKALGLHFPN